MSYIEVFEELEAFSSIYLHEIPFLKRNIKLEAFMPIL